MDKNNLEFTAIEGNPVLAMMSMMFQGHEFEVMKIEESKIMKYYVGEGGFEPVRGHYDDAGMDLRTPEDVIVPAGGSAIIKTKTFVEIPVGYYGKLESKSGLNVKHDVVCLGGVIDASYRGEIVVKLYNLGTSDYRFKAGDKVVQMIIQPCVLEEWVKDEDLSETERGDKGFGSTGA